jgi:hypothetical protein
VSSARHPSSNTRYRRPIQRRDLALIGILALAAVVRLATLDTQSFGDFETYTVALQRMDFSTMLSEIPEFEGTPPLYYVVSWFWAQVFGTGEVGLRLLPALFSVATVAITYAAGRTLIDRRAGLIAATLITLNPLAVWYAQEARAYSLLMFLTALGFWFFARALRGEGRQVTNLVGWSLVSSFALFTHYFAALVIVPEAIWLFFAAANRWEFARSVTPPLVTGVALVGLLIDQRDHAGGGEPEATALGTRIAQVPKQFLVGFNVPLEVPLTAAGVALAIAALWLLATRGSRAARSGARVAGIVAVAGAALLLMLAIVGFDYLLTRYLTVILVPCAIVLAAGFAATRTGLYAAAALSAVFVAALAGVQVDTDAQRPDLRGALEPLGEAPGGRAVFITTSSHIEAYLPGAEPSTPEGREVREVAVIGLSVVRGDGRDDPAIPYRPPVPFKLVEEVETDSYARSVYRAPHPVRISGLELLAHPSEVLLWLYQQPPP